MILVLETRLGTRYNCTTVQVQPTEQYQANPVEGEVITLERTAEKSKIPFLGFLMEEEEAIVVTQQKQENQAVPKKASRELYSSSNEEAASTAPEGKD